MATQPEQLARKSSSHGSPQLYGRCRTIQTLILTPLAAFRVAQRHYQLLAGRKLAGVIAAKRLETQIFGATEQTAYYAANVAVFLKIDCDQLVFSTSPPVSKLTSTGPGSSNIVRH